MASEPGIRHRSDFEALPVKPIFGDPSEVMTSHVVSASGLLASSVVGSVSKIAQESEEAKTKEEGSIENGPLLPVSAFGFDVVGEFRSQLPAQGITGNMAPD